MAKASGKDAKVEIAVDSSQVELMHLREWSISLSTDKIDASAAGDEWTDNIPGLKSWEGEAVCISVDDYWLDYIDGRFEITFYDDKSTVAYKGTASIDIERGASYDDVIESTLTFTGAGPLTHPTSGGTTS